jgi:thiamine-phosphate pyrophosphorylase
MKSHAIVNLEQPLPDSLLSRVEALVAAGVSVIQLRGKRLPAVELARAAERIRARIPRSGPRMVVNGRADIALASGADGVHLPSDGLPVRAVRQLSSSMIVGRSCHSLEEVRRAAAEGADYVILGPIFPPRSKQGGGPLGVDKLRQAVGAGVEVLAIGGISRQNLGLLKGSGIAGVAAITLFMEDEPIGEIVEAVRAL